MDITVAMAEATVVAMGEAMVVAMGEARQLLLYNDPYSFDQLIFQQFP